MSTLTPPTTWPPPLGLRPPRRLRQLWQVPAFLVGALVLAGVCLSRPYWHLDDDALQRRDIAAARRLLGQPDCSVERLQQILARPLEHEDAAPERAAEAHLILGTAYLRLTSADLSSCDDPPAPAGQAAEALRKAREHLERADALGAPASESARLHYQLGKALFLAREDPKRVVAALAGNVQEGAADNLAEGYGLLARAYLRLPEPDLKAALEANTKQMDLPTVSEDQLTPARLLRGELLLRLRDPAGAREVLQFIKPPAGREQLARARYLQAQSYEAEGEWTQAVRHWQEALAQREEGSPEAGRVLYHLGHCYRRMQEPEDAVKALEKALATAPPDEAVAAALGLAELRLLDNHPETALDAFRRAARDVASADDWKNPFWDLKATRELFERGCLIFHATGRYELSMQLAEVYEKLAAPGVTLSLSAQAAEAAGKAKLEQAKKTSPREAARPLEEAARGLFLQAAKKHEAAAEGLPPTDQADRLWQAAQCCLYAQDYPDASRLLARLAKDGPPEDRAAQVWFLLAEAERALRHDEAAVAAYAESSGHRGPYGYRARYQLAVLQLGQGRVDRAAELLEQNLNDLRTDRDPEAYQRTLFELAGLLFRRKSYHLASQRLEEALRHFPTAAEAVTARYQLGECYRFMAQQEFETMKVQEKTSPQALEYTTKLYKDRLAQAAATHEELLKVLKARAASGPLTADEEGLYWRATLAAAECRADGGDFEGPIASYEAMAGRYQGRVEALYALAGIARCYFLQNKPDRGREVLERMRKLVESMGDSAFPATPGMLTKSQWRQWVSDRLPTEARRP